MPPHDTIVEDATTFQGGLLGRHFGRLEVHATERQLVTGDDAIHNPCVIHGRGWFPGSKVYITFQAMVYEGWVPPFAGPVAQCDSDGNFTCFWASPEITPLGDQRVTAKSVRGHEVGSTAIVWG